MTHNREKVIQLLQRKLYFTNLWALFEDQISNVPGFLEFYAGFIWKDLNKNAVTGWKDRAFSWTKEKHF